MKLEQYQDLIQAFLNGALSAEERAAFERQVGASTALAEELERHRYTRLLIRHEALAQGKILMDNVMENISIVPGYGSYEHLFVNGRRGFKYGMPILFAILLIIGGGGIVYQKEQAANAMSERARIYMRPLTGIIGFANDDFSNAAEAIRAYNRGDYNEAVERLNPEAQNYPDDAGIRLYLAVSYLMQDRHDKAEPLLRQLIQTDNLATVPAKWYLALSLLRQKRINDARILLNSIQSDVIMGTQVNALLNEFDR